MSNNPLVRFGAPKNINCTLGISGEFPSYTPGSAYTGTVSINGAQGATRVELLPPGTAPNGGAYIPLPNGDFAAGAAGWTVQTQTASPGFSFQSGAGRSGPGFLRWQVSGPMGNNDADVVFNTTLVQSTEVLTTGRFWARCTAIGTTTDTIYAQVAVQMQVFADAAGTQLLGSYLLGFLRFYEVLDWRPIVSSCPTAPGQYVRFSIWAGSGVAATLEFDDCEWDARGVPSSPPAALALPAGFTIDTVTSPDRVRVQWPAIPTSGQSAYSLLHFDGSFADDAGLTWTLRGSPTTTTSQSRFGGASGSFAVGNGMHTPEAINWTYSSDNDNGNWTMEFWLYLPNDITDYQPIVSLSKLAEISEGMVSLRIGYPGANTNELYFGSASYSGGNTGYSLPTGQWVHTAIVRDRGNTRVYADGALRYSDPAGASAVGMAIIIGRDDFLFGPSSGFTGFMDEFRFVLGSALYTGSTYTVPTAPFVFSGGSATSTLPNLNFESGDVNWIKGAGWSITQGGLVDGGTWSAKYNGVGQSSIFHETLAPVTPGTTITASCRISKGNNRKDFAGGRISLWWYDANTRFIGSSLGNIVNEGTAAFQTSTVTGTAPSGAAYVRIDLSGTRDVKGRTTDVVAIDSVTWNHTFALGGTGGSGGTATPTTGPITLTFRVTDAQGCSAVATRTINQA